MNALTCVGLVFGNRLKVKKAALGGIAFFGKDDLHPRQLRLVGEHLDETIMRDGNEVLVGAATQVDVLLPPVVLANHESSDALFDQPINDAAAGAMQISVDAAIAFVGQSIQAARGLLVTPELALQLCPLLVVELIDGFERSAVNQKRSKTGLVEGYSRYIVQSNIDTGNTVGVLHDIAHLHISYSTLGFHKILQIKSASTILDACLECRWCMQEVGGNPHRIR